MAFQDDPIVGDLKIDRGSPVGNSPGEDGRGRLHTKISNTKSELIPIFTNQFAPPPLTDYIKETHTGNIQTFVFKSGGALGTILRTVTITYNSDCSVTYEAV